MCQLSFIVKRFYNSSINFGPMRVFVSTIVFLIFTFAHAQITGTENRPHDYKVILQFAIQLAQDKSLDENQRSMSDYFNKGEYYFYGIPTPSLGFTISGQQEIKKILFRLNHSFGGVFTNQDYQRNFASNIRRNNIGEIIYFDANTSFAKVKKYYLFIILPTIEPKV
ncbi:MAG: hypothetical protein ACI8SE_001753 [Bacteroidia bacterium]|jgi:hypothetical protein